ncbi:MAG: hypothetical protein V1913_08390 [Fibrobacterota bacterium]
MIRLFFLLTLTCLAGNWVRAEDLVGQQAYTSYYRMHYKRALAAYVTGLKNAEASADIKKQVFYINNIASVFFGLGQSDSSRAYLALAKERAAGHPVYTAVVDINNALLTGSGNPPSESMMNRLKDSLPGGDYHAVLTAVGRLYLATGQNEKAVACLKKSMDYFTDEKLGEGNATAGYYLAKAYARSGNTSEAQITVDETLIKYRALQYTHGIRKCLELKIELCNKSGDNAGAAVVRQQLERMRQ